MARKNKDIEILVKLVTQGNFDEAQKQLERLKTGQNQAATSGVGAFAKLTSAYKAWTSVAMTSASAMRKAWLTALGPISAIIIVLQTLKSMFGFIFTAVSNYRKAQEETNKTVREAADVINAATSSKNKYADAKGIDQLNAALKVHRADLEAISRKNEEIAKKTEGAGKQWYNVLGIVSRNNRALIDQIPLLAQAEIEAKKEIKAKEEALELTKKQEEAEKKRAEAAESVSRRIEELTLSETDLKMANLDRQLQKYEEAGVSAVEIERLRALETAKIQEDATRKAEEEKRRQAQAIEQIEMELQQRMAELEGDTLGQKQAALDQEIAARRSSYTKITQDKVALGKFLTKLDVEHLKRSEALVKAEVKMKGAAALQIADLSIQALTVINSMSELKSKEDARRAKFLLALEKGIAIARAIAAAQSAGPFAAGVAAAQIALITAQFAQQSKAIDQAQKASSAGASSFTVETPLPGGGTLEQEIGSGASASTSGGSSFSSSAVASGSGGSGGGGSTVINVGPVHVNFSADHVDLSEINTVARRLGDEVRRGTVEAARMARSIYNLGADSSALAV